MKPSWRAPYPTLMEQRSCVYLRVTENCTNPDVGVEALPFLAVPPSCTLAFRMSPLSEFLWSQKAVVRSNPAK